MISYKEIKEYIDAHAQEGHDLLVTLARIPAPSNHEEERAEFCRRWLSDQGAEGVYVDEALDVIYPIGLESHEKIIVFMAHTDVVFPDMTPLPLVEEEGKIKCPGVGDDTANVAALLLAAKYLAGRLAGAERAAAPLASEYGILLVCNSGEEGLGNLKGSRAICEAFGDRIEAFYSFDGTFSHLTDRAVGSIRYEVEVKTIGGHSYGSFGNPNAIAILADILRELYKQKVPEGGKTTFNVGTIHGGTSVNTIAQQVSMLYEFRADRRENLDFMERQFKAILAFYKDKKIDISVKVLGERPCEGIVDQIKREQLLTEAAEVVKKVTGIEPKRGSGSTDCNIPLFKGIPSVCLGVCAGAGAHTREEYVETDSLVPGYEVALRMILGYFGGVEG